MTSDSRRSRALTKRIAAAIGRADRFGYAERLWPRLVVAGSVLGLFLALSWLGVWPLMPDLMRFAVVGVLAAALLAALVWTARTPRLTEKERVKRVEHASRLDGTPLATLADEPFDRTDPKSLALWQVHRARVEAQIARLKSGTPAPRTELVDRWALRAPVLLVLVVAFFVAGPERWERIEQAFAPPMAAPGIPLRIDVWATPPGYTGLPPRTLVAGADLQPDLDANGDATQPEGAVVPVGSRLTVLVSDPLAVEVEMRPMDGAAPSVLSAAEDAPTTFETQLTSDTALVLASRGRNLTLPLLVTPDRPPLVRFAGDLEATPAGGLILRYHAEDDYAVTSIHADVSPADERFTDAVALVDAPRIDLVLPPARSGGSVETTRDLSAHPWAGLEVDMTLVALDGADQEATSETIAVTLPQRPFREPLARALVEQRRLLAVDERLQPQVLTALEALALAPEAFMDDGYATFLALTVTTQRLRFASVREERLEVIEMLWQLALQVEDGDLSLASERLRQAEENLAEALERGAGDEEIAQLMDELRNAFQAYMQELAQRLQNGDMAEMPPGMPMQSIDPSALQDLMDQIQDLSELGAADAARQLMEQLRSQLEQLRGAQAMQQREPNPQEQALREAVEELQAITREQQRLLDETFPLSSDALRPQVRPSRPFTPPGDDNQQSPRGANPSDNGQNSEEGAERHADALEGLARDQQALQEQLQALMDQLRDLGLDPQSFGEADDAMGDAGGMLDRGSAQGAVPEQGRALDALRQGAQSMMEQLAGQGEGQGGGGQAQGPGQSPGPGQGLPRLMFGPGNDGPRGTDPLGRPQRAPDAERDGPVAGQGVQIPEERDIQRARDILNEIQRRLGERARPQRELEYLDRLIDRF